MAFEPIGKGSDIAPGSHWVEVTMGMSGWFAVEVWLNNQEPDLGPFAEPWDTGVGRYRTQAEACVEAWGMAYALQLPYRLPCTPGMPEFDIAQRAMAQRAT